MPIAGFNWENFPPVWTGPSGVPHHHCIFIPAVPSVPESGPGKENAFVARGGGAEARRSLALSLVDVSLPKLGKVFITRTDAVT